MNQASFKPGFKTVNEELSSTVLGSEFLATYLRLKGQRSKVKVTMPHNVCQDRKCGNTYSSMWLLVTGLTPQQQCQRREILKRNVIAWKGCISCQPSNHIGYSRPGLVSEYGKVLVHLVSDRRPTYNVVYRALGKYGRWMCAVRT